MAKNTKSSATRQYRTEAGMFFLIEEYLDGEQTQKNFCSDQGLSLHVFGYWLRRYRESGDSIPEPGFVAVGVADRPGQLVEVEYPGGTILRFDSLPELNYLKALLGS